MRFTGNLSAKSDSKGRLFLPAAFRKILQAAQEGKLVLRRDIFQRCLVLHPESVWNGLVDEITRKTSPFDRRGRALLRQFVAEAELLTLDSDGRILIPKRHQEAINLQKEVRFVGVDNVIELWAAEEYELSVIKGDDFADALEALLAPHEAAPQASQEMEYIDIDDYKPQNRF